MDLRDLFKQAPGNVLTVAELRPYASPMQLARLVGKGVIEYDGRGTYRLKGAPPDYVIAKQLRGVLSHRSAAAHWRLPVIQRTTPIEVTVNRSRRRVRAPDGVLIYRRDLSPDERDGDVTTAVRTIVDCARDLDVPTALAMADAAVRTGDVALTDLVEAAARLRGHGSARARRVIGWIDPRSASVLESAVRGVLLDGGITGFVPQFPVKISTGRVLHADLGHEEARLLVEADSKLAHTGIGRVELDALRCTEFAAAGYTLQRFTWTNVKGRRRWMVEMVRSALEQRGLLQDQCSTPG